MIIKTTKKSKDSKYKFSVFILVTSIIGLFISGYFTFRSFQGPQETAAGQVATAAGQVAKLNSNVNTLKNSIPTTEQIEAIVNQDSLSELKGKMVKAIDGFISELGDIKVTKAGLIQARIQGLNTLKSAMKSVTPLPAS